MFKHSGFIRKNTPLLRKKLEEAGYVKSTCSEKDGDSICTSVFGTYIIIKHEMYDDPNPVTSWHANRKECKTIKEFIELVSQKYK